MGIGGHGVGGIVGTAAGILGGGFGGESASEEATTNNGIAVGDLVALLPISGTGGQKFIVLGKLAYGTELEQIMAAAEESSGGSGGMDIGTISSIAGAFE